MKDAAYLSLLGELPEKLIFIMGYHRTGTTFLQDSLVQTGYLDYISRYDIVCYDDLLFNHFNRITESVQSELKRKMELSGKDRGIDHVPLNPLASDEYGWIINKKIKRNSIFEAQITPKSLEKFLEICRKKQLINQDKNKPLILKNPGDAYDNFLYVNQQFPNARYIFIVRHPLKTINSNITAMRYLLSQKDNASPHLFSLSNKVFADQEKFRLFHYSCYSKTGLAFFVKAFIKSYQYYIDNINKLPSNNYLVIRYEDLCSNHEDVFGQCCRFINIPFEPKLFANRVSQRKFEPLEEVKEIYDRYLPQLRFYLTAFNYPDYPN